MAQEAEWLDVEAAARYLDFRPKTIYRMIREGRIPALRFPVRVRREDLDTCIERCRIKPGELAHLDQYARGDHRSPDPLITKAGTVDRRFGPRTRPSAPPDLLPTASAAEIAGHAGERRERSPAGSSASDRVAGRCSRQETTH